MLGSTCSPLWTLRARQGWGNSVCAPRRGRHDGFTVGRRRQDVGTPGLGREIVWPEAGSANGKEGRTTASRAECFCTSEQERARASECGCRRPQTASYSGDAFSRQRWKHGLFVVNSAPARPPHSATYSSLAPFQGRPPARAGRRAGLRLLPGLDPLRITPGVATLVCGQRAEGA